MKKYLRYTLLIAAAGIAQITSSHGASVIYEGFDYDTSVSAGLNGKGGSETGLTGTWSANGATTIGTPGDSFGGLQVSGNEISIKAGGNNFGGARSVSASALAGNGLLVDGATLWFSVIMGFETGGNLTNTTLAFTLANSSFSTSNFRYHIQDEGAQLGSGLGVVLGRTNGGGSSQETSPTAGRVYAVEFKDNSAGNTGLQGGWQYGSIEAGQPTPLGSGESTLVVGKYTWGTGGANDTLDIYRPDANMNLGSVISTVSANLDQSKFDTITFSRGDPVSLDEIRFGATLADVTPVVVPEPSSLLLLGLSSLALLRRRR